MSQSSSQKIAMFEFFETNFKDIVEMFKTEFDVNIDDDGQSILDTYEKEMKDKLSEFLEKDKKGAKKEKKDKKKKKDPAAPKRCKNPYIFFCTSKRPEIKEEYPTEPAKGIIKKLGEAWRDLSDDEKQPFIRQAAVDKKRYSQDMDNYVPSSSSDDEPDKKKKKKGAAKNESKGKRPPSGYILFCADMRAELKEQNPDASFGQIGRLLGEAWASDDERKAEYNERAAKLKADNEEDVKEVVEEEEIVEEVKTKAKKPKAKTSKK